MNASVKRGGCHCGAVLWEAETDDDIVAEDCNCSICQITGYLHVIVPRSRFNLVQGGDHLRENTFNSGVAKHLFCRFCGVKSFYIPRSNPDGYSLNLRCMDRFQFRSVLIRAFDGRNWEKDAARLSQLSKE